MPRDENIPSTEFFNSGAILALTVSVLVANMGFLSKNFYAHIVAYSGYICQCGKIAAVSVAAIGGGSRKANIATVIQTSYDIVSPKRALQTYQPGLWTIGYFTFMRMKNEDCEPAGGIVAFTLPSVVC